MRPVTVTWTHGNQPPPVFAENGFPAWGWGVFVGAKGMLLANYSQWMLWPAQEFADFEPPEPSIPSSIGAEIGRRPEWIAAYKAHPAWRRTAEVGHRAEWIAACKSGAPTLCNFDYSGAVTESVLLGNIAYRIGETLEWDAADLTFTNSSVANDYLRRVYRKGWQM